MAKDFAFPVERELKFPERCVCCGKPKEVEFPMKVSRLIQQKQKQVQRSVSLAVPLCARCKRTDQQVFLISLLLFVLGMLVVGLGCFALLTILDVSTGFLTNLGVDNVPGKPGAWLIIAGSVSFLVGFAGGVLFEGLGKFLFIPMIGRALVYAPFLGVQILGNVEYVAGLRGHLSADAKLLHLRFFNKAVATEFENLNSG